MKLNYTFETIVKNVTEVEFDDEVVKEFFGSLEYMDFFFRNCGRDFGGNKLKSKNDFDGNERKWKLYKDIREKLLNEFPLEENHLLNDLTFLFCEKFGKFGET